MKQLNCSISKKRSVDLDDFKMIRRYKVHSQIGKYKATFEMVLDDSTGVKSMQPLRTTHEDAV